MKVVLPKIIFKRSSARAVSVTYEAVLDVSADSVAFVACLLACSTASGPGEEPAATPAGSRLGPRRCWCCAGSSTTPRMSQLARDNAISTSTAYEYRDEGIAVLDTVRPSLHGALLAAKMAGHSHVIVDGTLIHTDRNRRARPDRRCRSVVVGQASSPRRQHPGRVRPRRLTLWTSAVRPGREHDTTAARADPALLIEIAAWVADGRPSLADLGYQGAPDIFTIPFKKPKGQHLTVDQQSFNAVHGALRCLGERANSLLKTTYKALRRYRGCPWRLGDTVAAALVLLHRENARTT